MGLRLSLGMIHGLAFLASTLRTLLRTSALNFARAGFPFVVILGLAWPLYFLFPHANKASVLGPSAGGGGSTGSAAENAS